MTTKPCGRVNSQCALRASLDTPTGIGVILPSMVRSVHAPLSLRGARELVGLNQAELAKRSGLRQQHYSDLERGQPLTPPEHLAVLRALRAAGLAGLTANDLSCVVQAQEPSA